MVLERIFTGYVYLVRRPTVVKVVFSLPLRSDRFDTLSVILFTFPVDLRFRPKKL